MYKIEEYVDIKELSTLKIGGQFRYFLRLEDKDDLPDICNFARNKDIKIFILGGGSNIIFSDIVLNVLALKMEIKGFYIINENDKYVDIKIGAGENWDNFVESVVFMGLSGVESLSAIPGTVGASPVQNIGAYGKEVKDTILEVEVFDIENNIFLNINNKDCKFGYRDSIFKNSMKGKYIIVSVSFRLNKNEPSIPNYPDILKYFSDKNISNPSLLQIRNAVIEIRKNKLPNPKECPNVGSFFKNPIVKEEIANSIKNEFPDVKLFWVDDNLKKISAGWLIDKSGLKGKSFGNISIYDKNALVLVNKGNATKDDLIKAKNEIVKIVQDKFGIILEQEPEMI